MLVKIFKIYIICLEKKMKRKQNKKKKNKNKKQIEKIKKKEWKLYQNTVDIKEQRTMVRHI